MRRKPEKNTDAARELINKINRGRITANAIKDRVAKIPGLESRANRDYGPGNIDEIELVEELKRYGENDVSKEPETEGRQSDAGGVSGVDSAASEAPPESE